MRPFHYYCVLFFECYNIQAKEGMDMNILVLDDEKEIADLVEVFLKNEGYEVFKFYDSISAQKCIEKEKIDLALLDVMLPDTDGFSILRSIREKGYIFPVIMLTAKCNKILIISKSILNTKNIFLFYNVEKGDVLLLCAQKPKKEI